MGGRTYLLFAFLAVLLLGSLSSAQAVPDLLIDAQAIDSEINFDEVAHYQVELTNNRDDKMSLTVPIPRNQWDITIKPYIIELGAHKSQLVDIYIAPPQVVKAGVYSVYFKFNDNGTKLLDYKYLHVKVLEESPVVEAKINIIEEIEAKEYWSEEFLVKEYSVTIMNKGNAVATGNWETPITQMSSFFLTSEGNELIGDRANTRVSWNYEIPVGDEATFSYRISYLPLFVAVILILVALSMLGIYYMSRYRLVKSIEKKKDGYISIELAIKNKTGKVQKNVVLEDHIPVPFMLSREFGTMKPSAVKQHKDKLNDIWKFEELQPKEERMLSYKMKSKIEVEGKILIPAAKLTQKEKGKKPIEVFSKIKQL